MAAAFRHYDHAHDYERVGRFLVRTYTAQGPSANWLQPRWLLHRGFDQPGEPPEDGLEGRRFMQWAPNFRKDLQVVVEAPNGVFASYCGMWYESVNRIAYVEPVATDPDYRRMGRAGRRGGLCWHCHAILPVYGLPAGLQLVDLATAVRRQH